MKRGIISALVGMVISSKQKAEVIPEPIQKMRADNIRQQAINAGIVKPRAAMQRAMMGTPPDVPDRKEGETRKEKKARLIAKGTASLMRRGYSRKEAEAIAKRSYAEAVRSVGNAAQGR
ncbi:hypothetical protein [Enterobacter hormaechei]|uniref:hypothetical protein n=1 Tax=Enterobacter hormaechei TaxID=158836 RepID=UPI003F4298EB